MLIASFARVVPAQEKFIKFLEDSRYDPVKSAPSGFVLLSDLQPSEHEVFSSKNNPSTVSPAADDSITGEQGSAVMDVDEKSQPPQTFKST